MQIVRFRSWMFPLAMLVLLIVLAACTEKSEKPAPPPPARPAAVEIPTKTLLTQSVPLQRVELTTEALTVWRQFAPGKPTLLLLSARPMLTPAPESLRKEIATWVQTANREEIVQRSAPEVAKLLLLLDSTVDAALRADWLREVAWVIPGRESGQEYSVESLRTKLVAKGQVSREEAETIRGGEGHFKGTLRGVPFSAALWPQLPALSGPTIVHIDLSFIAQLYKNEVATPILPLIVSTLKSLREQKIPVVAVTFSYGNLENRIALDVRYQGEIFAYLVENPDKLEQPLLINWQRQGDILYLNDLYQKDRAWAVAEEMGRTDPQSAAVKYTLYRSAVARRQGKAALGYLSEAVQLDKIYALEYLELSRMALSRKRPDQGLRMLELAAAVFPWNTQIKIEWARLAALQGDRATALRLHNELQLLPWETVYYPQMANRLAGLYKEIESGAVPPAAVPPHP